MEQENIKLIITKMKNKMPILKTSFKLKFSGEVFSEGHSLMNKTINIGLIGLGRIGKMHAINVYQKLLF